MLNRNMLTIPSKVRRVCQKRRKFRPSCYDLRSLISTVTCVGLDRFRLRLASRCVTSSRSLRSSGSIRDKALRRVDK
jgi:hypothetical protein